MADEPQAGNEGQGADGKPPAGEPTRKPEEYEAEIKALRAENAKHRTEKQEFRAKLEAALAGGDPATLKTAVDEAVKRAEAAEQQARDISIRAQLERQARAAGVVDEDAVVRLLDMAALKIGDDGVVQNADKAIDALVQAKPWLKPTATAPPSAGVTNPPAGNRTTLTRDEVRKMTPEQINANWPMVEAALKV